MSERVSGLRQAMLGNAISDAIHNALLMGLEVDEAACITAAVAADYARGEYGNGYLEKLAGVVRARAEEPAPRDISRPSTKSREGK